jgi:hydrogenase maturation protein HypF
MIETSFTLAKDFTAPTTILAMGAELKSGCCLLQGRKAQLFQLGGDLEQAAIFHRYQTHIDELLQQADPACIALDYHPDYLSSQLGRGTGLPTIMVQHHHAHIAACLAEHERPLASPAVLGIALDGLGLSADGQLWGGEFLRADYCQAQRLATFEPIAMLGGAQAIKQPWRNTLAHLAGSHWEAFVSQFGDTDIIRFLQQQPLAVFNKMIQQGLNAPLASSAGRLFDAVAASLNIHRHSIDFEAQAAIMLEQHASTAFTQETVHYPFGLNHRADGVLQLQWSPMWFALLRDIQLGCANTVIAARFHRTLIQAVTSVAGSLCQQHGLDHVVLTGGVFQNQLLRHGIAEGLRHRGLHVLIPQHSPTHDGGLALGQAVVAAARSSYA